MFWGPQAAIEDKVTHRFRMGQCFRITTSTISKVLHRDTPAVEAAAICLGGRLCPRGTDPNLPTASTFLNLTPPPAFSSSHCQNKHSGSLGRVNRPFCPFPCATCPLSSSHACRRRC